MQAFKLIAVAAALPLFSLAASWQQTLQSFESQANDQFGKALAVSGTVLAVGAPNLPSSFVPGYVYIYQRGPAWLFNARLQAPAPTGGDTFGASLAMEGNTLVVGAPANGIDGKVYVFNNANGVWRFQQTLQQPAGTTGNTSFGSAVALSRSTIAVGAPSQAPGSVHVFVKDNTGVWVPQARLAPSDTANTASGFGTAVAVADDTIIAGAPGTLTANTSLTGAAYIFGRRNNVWTQQSVFLPMTTENAKLGTSVAMSGNTAVLGAPGVVQGAIGGHGYVLIKTSTGWVFQSVIFGVPTEGAAFGAAVAINSGVIATGSPLEPVAGTATTWTSPGVWVPAPAPFVSDGTLGQNYGASIAISGGNSSVLVGAPQWGTSATPAAAGIVYAYQK